MLIFSYKEQLAWVRWGRGSVSEEFGISNGMRQGSVGSPTFWSVYLKPIFSILRNSGYGCRLAGLFTGVIGYADDLILLAPNRKAAQKMLEICEEFAKENNISFSTNHDPNKSKSKALFMGANHDQRTLNQSI